MGLTFRLKLFGKAINKNCEEAFMIKVGDNNVALDFGITNKHLSETVRINKFSISFLNV